MCWDVLLLVFLQRKITDLLEFFFRHVPRGAPRVLNPPNRGLLMYRSSLRYFPSCNFYPSFMEVTFNGSQN